ncbi:hypothetical protein [Bacteroides oleiciplenus]|uniref:hypothetical protein n=1 Tax=Bacteroides oleiciplenus TaxID=626931 RepID=UPI0026DA7447|nr:hypothetical protein [Bacteroides oleiciplenus]
MKNIKGILVYVYRFIFPYPKVRYCSQTIYEALLGCLRMYEATEELKWKMRSEKVVEILKKIQMPDGGFDIGYDFFFGMMHKKGDSTSPEMVGLLALTEYARVFSAYDDIQPYADRAVCWIKRNVKKVSEGVYAIPYSPYTTSEIMVYNGTSFVCAALGYYIGVFQKKDIELSTIYQGMINYLEKSMYSSESDSGKFWYYPVQERKDISELMLSKIDYYHQMQQVEVHSYAQQVNPNTLQAEMIKNASEHVISLSKRFEITPYTNNTIFFKDHIHVWGLCSVASGLMMAQDSLEYKIEGANRLIEKIIVWIKQFSWNGTYFYPILSSDGVPQMKQYMVRSDAWVFNTLCLYYKKSKDSQVKNILEKVYLNIEKYKFSGRESHAYGGKRDDIAIAILKFIRKK